LRRLKSWDLARHLHPRLSWPANLKAAEGSLERLGWITVHMGPRHGPDLIRSLNLERPASQCLLSALEVHKRRASPRSHLSPLALAVLRHAEGRLPRAALDPLKISGEDLKRLGLGPGPCFRALLDRAASAQWSGEFSTRAGALRWLRSQVVSG